MHRYILVLAVLSTISVTASAQNGEVNEPVQVSLETSATVQPQAPVYAQPYRPTESTFQLESPELDLPTRHYRWLPALFSAGAVTSVIGAIGYGLSGYCDGSSCEGRESNGLLLIPAFGGLALFVGGLVGFIINKVRYGRALRRQSHPLVVAW